MPTGLLFSRPLPPRSAGCSRPCPARRSRACRRRDAMNRPGMTVEKRLVPPAPLTCEIGRADHPVATRRAKAETAHQPFRAGDSRCRGARRQSRVDAAHRQGSDRLHPPGPTGAWDAWDASAHDRSNSLRFQFTTRSTSPIRASRPPPCSEGRKDSPAAIEPHRQQGAARPTVPPQRRLAAAYVGAASHPLSPPSTPPLASRTAAGWRYPVASQPLLVNTD